MGEDRSTRLVRDGVIVFFSIIIAVILVRGGLIDSFVTSLAGSFLLTAFVAGILFTSVFTTAIGIATFLVLGNDGYNPFIIAALGGLGAVVGDMLIFRFLKNDITEDIDFLLDKLKQKSVRKVLRSKVAYWVMPLLGGIIIASPLPDELGVALLALAKVKIKNLALFSFAFNSAGIALLVGIGDLLPPLHPIARLLIS